MDKNNSYNLPKGWIKETLRDSIYIKSRIGWKGLKKSEYVKESSYRIINGINLVDGRIDWDNCGYISKERYDESPEIMLKKNDIVMTKDGTIGKIALVEDVALKSTVASGLFVLRVENIKVYYKYLYYYLTSPLFQKLCISRIEGSVIPHLYQRDLVNLVISLPPMNVQKAIANILSSLDDKIELNNKMNKILEEISQALYKQWFVDFEFPNKDGNPYRSSGGEMIESELGLIPKGWEVGKLSDIIVLHDNKRIPLSKSEREKRGGDYPYYGAASLMDHVDDYIFDGRYVLLGEDGTVEDDNGYPVLQFVEGKFWVNNHAHVLQGKNGYDVNSLFVLLTNTNIHSIITGAVQKKVNQTNLKSLKVLKPTDLILGIFNEIIKPLYDMKLSNERQNTELSKTRDTLLPKLMSGEIEVPIEE